MLKIELKTTTKIISAVLFMLLYSNVQSGNCIPASSCFHNLGLSQTQALNNFKEFKTSNHLPLVTNSRIESIEICNNGIDDDGDGLIDCEDNDCYFSDSICKCKEINVLWGADFSGNVLWFNVATGVEHIVGNTSIPIIDISWAANGKLYGISSPNLYEIDPNNGSVINTLPVINHFGAGLTTDNNGIFYYDGNGHEIYSYNTLNNQTNLVASFNPAYKVSGDLAFKDGVLLVITYDIITNLPFLIKIDIFNGTSTIVPINNIPSGVFLYGLVNSANGIVYASGDNVIYSLDIVTGNATVVFNSTLSTGYVGLTNISATCQGVDTSCMISTTILNKHFCSSSDTLSATVNSIKAYETIWYLPNGDSTKNISTVSPIMNGLYEIKVRPTGCTNFATDTFTVQITQLPNLNIGNDTTICNGTSLVLNATTPNATYLWNDNSTNPTLSINGAGLYFVEVTEQQCQIVDTILINIENVPDVFSLGNDTSYCLPFSRILSTGIQTTIWSTGQSASNIIATSPGKYWAKISNQCGDKIDTIEIKNATSIFNLGADTTICIDTINLKINDLDFVRFLWSTGDTTSSININIPSTYFVTATNKNICSYTDTIKIIEYCESNIYIPTAFSPNNDGIHDVLDVFINNPTSFNLKIFNRWGELVFESNDVQDKWNGNFKGEIAPVDTYAWFVTYTTNNTTHTNKGSVAIIR